MQHARWEVAWWDALAALAGSWLAPVCPCSPVPQASSRSLQCLAASPKLMSFI